ncbi:response regulator receiver protein [Spirosoma sp. SC4-14]|uniref:response regulator receiver protein n=1 Tax=Spirosoma sp. SC4-14 TaxID=3128900 RepID=UPI0030CE437E
MKAHILYIGLNSEINPVMLRLLNSHNEWDGVVADSCPEAIRLFQEQRFDLVLLGNGLSEAEEAQLRKQFCSQQPAIIVVEHYGGGSGLLAGEIRQALASLNQNND